MPDDDTANERCTVDGLAEAVQLYRAHVGFAAAHHLAGEVERLERVAADLEARLRHLIAHLPVPEGGTIHDR